jgi:GntR family transcriptional regulator, trigonelline degradation regulator
MNRDSGITVVAAPLRKQVIELLRNAIVAFEYKPGERLVERDLCERFDVSRTVVREALRHLEAEGLINIVANRGPIVSSPTVSEARALYEVREALESLAARLCAERASAAKKRKLARALQHIALAYAEGELAVRLRAKDEFYRVLCDGADNAVIGSTLRGIQARVQMLRGLSLQAPGRREESLEELRALTAAIERGDTALAARLAAEHVRSAASTALATLHDEGAAAADSAHLSS